MASRPVTAATSSFTFYDIESLSNVFSLVAYTPRPGATLDDLEIFFLVDDDALDAAVDPGELYRVFTTSNPGLPPVSAKLWNLRRPAANERLAAIMGLSDADQVCDPRDRSTYPAALRPVCDTDEVYSPQEHPFLAGYNSMNYDTVMLALYLNEAFSEYPKIESALRHARSNRANAEKRLRSTQLVAAGVAPTAQADVRAIEESVASWREREQHESSRVAAPAPPSAALMRRYNDELFSEAHIDYMPGYLPFRSAQAKIRQSMLRSGRHLDVARLNEGQFSVGLKRLLGMLGHQIKESEKLGHDSVITTSEELYELLSYNVSDCLGLSQLFTHPIYAGGFDLKAGLLAQYDETRFLVRGGRRGDVRKDRLAVDSSSAKFVGRILAPTGHLDDDERVSFRYPHPEEAKAQGVEVIDVLDEAVRFFEQEVAPEPETNPRHAAAREQFGQIVAYYRSIEGRNFNDSDEYQEVHRQGPAAKTLSALPKLPNNIPYFLPDGSPSSCFVTFSTGGIHGAEADLTTFVAEQESFAQQCEDLARARAEFPEATAFVARAKDQHHEIRLPDGTVVDKRLVLIGSTPENVRYRKPKAGEPEQAEQLERAQKQIPDPVELLARQRPKSEELDVVLDDGTVLHGKDLLANRTAANAAYRERPAKAKPELFTAKEDGATKLHPKFTHTSASLVVHEDFTSYYPNLLRNMRAFYNPQLGEDRYATIFFEKERLGAELKKPGLTAAEKAHLKTLRNGTKLILNSASGAGDAGHRTPIRMNNRIISMRIMGQLFSWLIGQAQTLAGARIISTNTDGLYSAVGEGSDIDEATNNRVLAERSASINIDIEPELMFLISKDSNNRLELEAPREGSTVADSEIITAGGGTLACFGGPRPDKSLAHPALIDAALARYLQITAARGEQALAEPYDPELGARVIHGLIDHDDPIQTLMMFQNVIAASRGSITYPFAVAPFTDPEGERPVPVNMNRPGVLHDPRALQMINRVFIVRRGTEGACSLLNAGAWKVNPASRARREAAGDVATERYAVAMEILRRNGRGTTSADARSGMTLVPQDQDVAVRKISGIDPAWSMLIVNDDLHTLARPELDRILSALDLKTYVEILGETFTGNWRNAA